MKKYILLLLLACVGVGASAQTLAQAKAYYEKGDYEKAKPAFKKLVKSQPYNGSYNLWYGVCLLKTGEADESVKYLEMAVKKRTTGGQLYLGQAYDELYRYEDAVDTFEEYIAELEKRKRPTEAAEALLESSRAKLRMLKGVEQVCVIDSFVVDKESFLQAYKISPESGKLSMYDTYFGTSGNPTGTVYETELGNKLYYGEMQPDSTLSILVRNKLLDQWSAGTPLPGSINEAGNANYPYVLSDGITLYYAADGEDSMGGYDIFVTRYNTGSETYLTPENVGMPFNSPYNDYMYVIDEFNNLGWFASDRYQPADKVCVYVFIPATTKQVYSYEDMDTDKLIRLAKLHAIRETWTDEGGVEEALLRLEEAGTDSEADEDTDEGNASEFVIDDTTSYWKAEDFRSPEAKAEYRHYLQLWQDYQKMAGKLEQLRNQYAQSGQDEQKQLVPAILDLERRLPQLGTEVEQAACKARYYEKQVINP